MNRTESTRFEDLCVELIAEILEYFSANEIYFSFSQLNIRFNSIIKSFPHLSITINERSDPSIYCFFASFESIYMGLYYSSKNMFRSRTAVKYNPSWYKSCPVSNYDFYYKPNLDIEQLFVQQKHSQLRSMILFYATSELTQSIFNGEYFNLRICHIRYCEPICLPSSTNVQSLRLRRLTIYGKHQLKLEKVLSICSSLSSLTLSSCSWIHLLTLKNHYFSSMKYLNLHYSDYKFRFHTGEFEQFLSLFPNLIRFHLTVHQCDTSNEIIDFAKIANYFQQKLQYLKVLNLRIYMAHCLSCSHLKQYFPDYTQLHPLFKYICYIQWKLMITSYNYYPHCPDSQKYVRPS